MAIVAALLLLLLVVWGVARWRSAPSLVIPGAPEPEHAGGHVDERAGDHAGGHAAERPGGHEHVTQEDRAALERVLRERAPAP